MCPRNFPWLFALLLLVVASCKRPVPTTSSLDAGTLETLPMLADAAAVPTVVASATPPPPKTDAGIVESSGVTALSPEEAKKIAQSVVDGGEPAHPFFRGNFGPSTKTVFGIVQTGVMSAFTPVAVAPKDDGTFETLAIEPLVDMPSWSGWQIDAVMFEDVDRSGKKSPIVIAEYMTGIGPTGAKPFTVVLVYIWKKNKLVHAKGIEKKLEDATTARGVRAGLAALHPPL